MLAFLVTEFIILVLFGSGVLVGVLTLVKADHIALRLAGYVVAVLFGFGGLALMVLVFLTSPGTVTSSSAVQGCEFFSSRAEAQHYYDKMVATDVSREREEGHTWWLDSDGNGIACDEGYSY